VSGVPASRPVDELKLAQPGFLLIENRSVSPSASLAAGWNRYAKPTVAVVAGEPLIVGAELPVLQRHDLASAVFGMNEIVSSTSSAAFRCLKYCM
jgi:hypothetical protein